MAKVVTGLRPGGRSAKIQEAVHLAVHTLQQNIAIDQITVPMIAAEAGVTPSTIYRRWGDIQQLFSDVAFAKLQPDAQPVDLGSYRADLYAWVEQYFEEYSSPVGRTLLSDVLGTQNALNARKCSSLICFQLDIIQQRAQLRNENFYSNQSIIEKVIAPMLFKILFTEDLPQLQYVHQLLDQLFLEK